MPKNSASPDSNEPDSSADFSIVIPAWNETDYIVEAVSTAMAAIAQQAYTGQVIVVDNNSTDDTASKAEQAGAQVVFESHNQISRARNAGAMASRSNWIVFVDADSTITPPLLTLALDALASDQVIGGGSTIVPDQPIKGFGAHVLGFWNWVSVKTQTAAGCFIYCRRDAFEQVGGFSVKLYAAEELLLSRELKKLAKQTSRRFVIQTDAPVTTSSRKLDWYSPLQMVWQFLLLMLPGATFSRKMCHMWYERGKISKN